MPEIKIKLLEKAVVHQFEFNQILECLCGCHRPTGQFAALHIRPCCEGKCSNCKLYFKHGLVAHTKLCGGEPKWSSSEMRNRK
jgi:hypothetical protein